MLDFISKNSWLSYLRHDEYAGTIIRMVSDAAEPMAEIEDQILQYHFGKLKTILPSLNEIKAMAKGHKMTPIIDALAFKRRETIRTIFARARSLSMSTLSIESDASIHINFWLKPYGLELTSRMGNAVTKNIDDMIEIYDSDEVLQSAIESGGMKKLIEALKTIHGQYVTTLAERTLLWGGQTAANDSKTIETRRSSMVEVNAFFAAIINNARWNGISEYKKLVHVIKKSLESTRVAVLRKQTLSKNKASSEEGQNAMLQTAKATSSDIEKGSNKQSISNNGTIQEELPSGTDSEQNAVDSLLQEANLKKQPNGLSQKESSKSETDFLNETESDGDDKKNAV